MPNYIVYPETEDTSVQSENEEYQKDNSAIAQNIDHRGHRSLLLDSELSHNVENFGSEEEESNFYNMRNITHNDSKLLIILSIGTLISLGILANSMFY